MDMLARETEGILFCVNCNTEKTERDGSSKAENMVKILEERLNNGLF